MKKALLTPVLVLYIFSLNAQYLTNVNPAFGYQNETLTVTISGQDTHFVQATGTVTNPTQVWLMQGDSVSVQPNYSAVINNNLLYAEFTFSLHHPVGLYDVNIFSQIDNLISMTQSFELNPDPFSKEVPSIETDDIIFPNPSNGQITINQENGEAVRFELFSGNGHLICSKVYSSGSFQQHLDLSYLPKGFYIYHMISATKTRKGKIVLE